MKVKTLFKRTSAFALAALMCLSLAPGITMASDVEGSTVATGKHSVVISTSEGGSLVSSQKDEQKVTTEQGDVNLSYAEGDKVELSVSAKDGYAYNGTDVSSVNNKTNIHFTPEEIIAFYMPSYDVKVVASFVNKTVGTTQADNGKSDTPQATKEAVGSDDGKSYIQKAEPTTEPVTLEQKETVTNQTTVVSNEKESTVVKQKEENVIQEEQKDIYQLDNFDYSKLLVLDFSSMRLLVGTEDESIFVDKDVIVSSYNDVYILQFSDKETALKAYAYYQEKADFVEVDTGIAIADGEAAEVVSTQTVMTESENPFTEIEETSIQGSYDIALIDTGADGADATVSVIGDDVSDENGHGNQMLALIKEQAPNAKVLSIKALDKDGRGDVSAVYAAIQMAINENVDIINLSISALASADSTVIEDAIDEAIVNGIIVVGAAGNNGRDAKYYVPGKINSAIIAGAANQDGSRLEISNYGDTVDYNVVAETTSAAAAKLSGWISTNGESSIEDVLNQGFVYDTDYEPNKVSEKAMEDISLKNGIDVVIKYLFVEKSMIDKNDSISDVFMYKHDAVIMQTQQTLRVAEQDGKYIFHAVNPYNVGLATEDPIYAVFAEGNDGGHVLTTGYSFDFHSKKAVVDAAAIPERRGDDNFSDIQLQVMVPSSYADVSDFYVSGHVAEKGSAILADSSATLDDVDNLGYVKYDFSTLKVGETLSTKLPVFIYDTKYATSKAPTSPAAFAKYDILPPDTTNSSYYQETEMSIVNSTTRLKILLPTKVKEEDDFLIYKNAKMTKPYTSYATNLPNGYNPWMPTACHHIEIAKRTVYHTNSKMLDEATATLRLIAKQTNKNGSITALLAVETNNYESKQPEANADQTTGAVFKVTGYSEEPVGYLKVKKSLDTPTANITLVKESANTSITNGNSNYSLKGAVYGIYSDKACTKEIGKMTTDNNGKATYNGLKQGTYYVKEISPSKGYENSDEVITYNLSTLNSLYGREATFRVFSDAALTKRVATITTDEDGDSDPVELEPGKYYVTEYKASKNCKKNTGYTPIDVPECDDEKDAVVLNKGVAENETIPYEMQKTTKEQPIVYHVGTAVTKKQVAGGTSPLPLSGAKIAVKYYTTPYTVSGIPEVNPKPSDILKNESVAKTWYFNTDETGAMKFDMDHFVSNGSDALYKDSDGTPCIPIGSVVLYEYAAPEGFFVNPNTKYLYVFDPYGKKEIRIYNDVKELEEQEDKAIADRATAEMDLILFDIAIPTIHTTLSDGEYNEDTDKYDPTGDHDALASETVTLVDRVHLIDLIDEKEYTLTGTLKYQENFTDANGTEHKAGDSLLDNEGNEITVSKDFTYELDEEEPDLWARNEHYENLTFTFDGSLLKGATIVAFESLEDSEGHVTTHNDLEDKDQTVWFPEIGTTLTDTDSQLHMAEADQEISLTDVVTLHNLIPETSYKIYGKLMDKDGETALLDDDGNAIEAVSEVFVADSSDMEKEITFTFSGKSVEDKTTVAFERLFTVKPYEQPAEDPDETIAGESVKLVAVHEDYDDEGQTVYFPGLGTTLTDEETGLHNTKEAESITLVDVVKYSNVIAGKVYTVHGILMDKKTGQPFIDADGNEITAESQPFIATADGAQILTDEEQNDTETGEDVDGENTEDDTVELVSGEITLQFTFNGSGLAGSQIVAFEYLEEDGVELGVHAELTDENQTVYIPDIGTTLTDAQTKEHIAKATKDITLIDTVKYEGLIPGMEYTVRGVLMQKQGWAFSISEGQSESQSESSILSENRTTGTNASWLSSETEGNDWSDDSDEEGVTPEPSPVLDDNGKEIWAETTFVPESADGLVDVVFTFRGVNLAGRSIVAYETLLHEDVELAVHADINDDAQTVFIPEIKTSLIDKTTEEHVSHASEKMTLIDTVYYGGLIVGKEYTMTGTLVDKNTGKELKDDKGKAITASTVFTPKTESGFVDVTFTFSGVSLAGKTVVAFESCLYEGNEVAVHADINDQNQTVTIPKIGTTLVNSKGKHEVDASDKPITLTDTVKYENLSTNKTYIIKGTLIDKTTKKAVKYKGKDVTATKKFKPKKSSGTESVTFTFVPKDYANKYVVAFEEVYEVDNGVETLIADHKDLNDKDQTVYIKKVPKTGDSSMSWLWIVIAITAIGLGTGGFVCGRKKRTDR